MGGRERGRERGREGERERGSDRGRGEFSVPLHYMGIHSYLLCGARM